MKRALKITGITLGIVLVILLAMLLYYLGVTANVRLDRDKLTMSTACVRLYDRYGEEIPVSVRTDAALETLPEHVGQAFVAVEDKRFYEHGGIDTRRVFAALWHNLTSFSFREGASTISQQLIKNTHLSSEKTIQRKLKELKLARILEKHYSKEQILALYLNSIYFGHSAFGIENAAQFYFGKHAEALDAAESAMLAAIVRSPNRYSPFRDAGLCLSRRNLVLRLMKEQGYLTEDACLAAQHRSPFPRSPHRNRRKTPISHASWKNWQNSFPMPSRATGVRWKSSRTTIPNCRKCLTASTAKAISARSCATMRKTPCSPSLPPPARRNAPPPPRSNPCSSMRPRSRKISSILQRPSSTRAPISADILPTTMAEPQANI